MHRNIFLLSLNSFFSSIFFTAGLFPRLTDSSSDSSPTESSVGRGADRLRGRVQKTDEDYSLSFHFTPCSPSSILSGSCRPRDRHLAGPKPPRGLRSTAQQALSPFTIPRTHSSCGRTRSGHRLLLRVCGRRLLALSETRGQPLSFFEHTAPLWSSPAKGKNSQPPRSGAESNAISLLSALSSSTTYRIRTLLDPVDGRTDDPRPLSHRSLTSLAQATTGEAS